ncbi:MAG TPA: MarR family transcriptional regulator [Gaiellaceae bacterium]|nr:MarR family transcriptional regulator [Gaiellaceae bacterium]
MSNDPLGRQLVFTAKAVREAFEEALHQAGGSLGTWVVLSALSDEGIISQSALGSHVHLEGATITHHIDRLEQLGLVRRQLDPKDRRVRNLELTEEGERLHKNLLAAMRGFERKLLDGLGERELTGLRTTLDRISANLS